MRKMLVAFEPSVLDQVELLIERRLDEAGDPVSHELTRVAMLEVRRAQALYAGRDKVVSLMKSHAGLWDIQLDDEDGDPWL
jgi:hypothetical protein